MLHQEKELSNDSGKPLSCYNFTDKKAKMATIRNCILAFSVILIFNYHYSKPAFKKKKKKKTTNLELA